jgi:hypothetical protein
MVNNYIAPFTLGQMNIISFNWIMKVDRRRNLVIFLCQLRWIDEAICLLQIHQDLKG